MTNEWMNTKTTNVQREREDQKDSIFIGTGVSNYLVLQDSTLQLPAAQTQQQIKNNCPKERTLETG